MMGRSERARLPTRSLHVTAIGSVDEALKTALAAAGYPARVDVPDAEAATETSESTQFFRRFFEILRPERSFYWLAIVYGVGISLLSLATPISVQMLVNTVANTALTAPLVMLSLTLFGLLIIFGLLYALRIHLMRTRMAFLDRHLKGD